jgi:predicted RNA-binding protein
VLEADLVSEVPREVIVEDEVIVEREALVEVRRAAMPSIKITRL